MSAITKVAIAGATGALGSALTQSLLTAGFQLTALTRDASSARLPAGVKAATVDYSSQASIQAALKGQDALVSALGGQGLDQQKTLVDAAIAAGIQRIIPSEFGSDHESDEINSLPVYADKVKVAKYLAEKTKGTQSTYTIINNNAFLDWGIEYKFFINVKDKTVNLFDGGDIPFTVTPLAQVGQAVVGVLRKPEETKNLEVRIHGRTTTINEIFALAKEFSSAEGWTATPYDTKEHLAKAYEALKTTPQDFYAWGIPMIYRAAFGKGLPVDFATKNDNELLGLKELSQDEFREVVKTSVQKSL